MKIETDGRGTCSWCKVDGVHPTLISWRWERRTVGGADVVRAPAVCGECWEKNEAHRSSGVPVRKAASEWAALERKFAPVEVGFGALEPY